MTHSDKLEKLSETENVRLFGFCLFQITFEISLLIPEDLFEGSGSHLLRMDLFKSNRGGRQVPLEGPDKRCRSPKLESVQVVANVLSEGRIREEMVQSSHDKADRKFSLGVRTHAKLPAEDLGLCLLHHLNDPEAFLVREIDRGLLLRSHLLEQR